MGYRRGIEWRWLFIMETEDYPRASDSILMFPSLADGSDWLGWVYANMITSSPGDQQQAFIYNLAPSSISSPTFPRWSLPHLHRSTSFEQADLTLLLMPIGGGHEIAPRVRQHRGLNVGRRNGAPWLRPHHLTDNLVYHRNQ